MTWLARAIACFLAITLTASRAAAQTWTGAAAPDANWSNPGNWSGGVPVSTANTQLTFATGTTDPNQNLVNPFQLNRLSFGGAFAQTISGNGLDFRDSSGGGVPAIVFDGPGSPRITSPLTFTDGTEIRGTGTGTLRISSTLTSTLSPGLPTAGDLTKSGSFDLLLDGDGSGHHGRVTVNGGRVVLGSAGALSGSQLNLIAPNGLAFAPGLAATTIGGLTGTAPLNLNAVELTIAGAPLGDQSFAGAITSTTGGITVTGFQTLTGGGTVNNIRMAGISSSLHLRGQTWNLTSTTNDDKAAILLGGGVAGTDASLTVINGARVVLAPGASAIVGRGTGVPNSDGLLTVSGVTTAVAAPMSQLSVGNGLFGTGRFIVTDGASTTWGPLLVGNGGAGVATVRSGGVVTSGATSILATNPLRPGSAVVTGSGSLWSMNTLQLNGSLTATDGGTVTVAGRVDFGGSGPTTVTGGRISAGSIAATSGTNIRVLLSDPTGGVALTVGSDNTSSTFAGSIADSTGGPGSLTKVGTGTQTLTGPMSYTGTTLVTGGTLVFSGGAVTGGTYRGTGGNIQFTNEVIDLGSSGQFRAEGTSAIRMQNVNLTGGSVSGPGQIEFSGATSTLTNTTLLSGLGTVLNVDTSFTHVTSSTSITVAGPRALFWTFGSMTSTGSLTVESGGTANLLAFNSSGLITVASGGTLNNGSSSALVVNSGSRMFIGTAAAPGGSLNLGGQTLELLGGSLVNNGSIVGTTHVSDFAVATGAGRYGPVNVTILGTFSPGNNVGSATTGPAALAGQSIFAVDLNDANGTAGVNWDLWLTPKLDINSGLGNNALRILMSTWTPTGEAGPMADFNPALSYDWVIVRTTDGITGFSPDRIRVGRADFRNPTNPGSHFEVALVGNELHLLYVPVPEPTALLLTAAAAVAGLWWRRVCRP